MSSFLQKTAIAAIKAYQKTLSLDHGFFSFLFPYGVCRFTPTCSEYCSQAIEKYGLIKGFFMGARRVLRCTPGHECGHDPVR